jgi:hypothetical protein
MKKACLALLLLASLSGCVVGVRHRYYGDRDRVVFAPDYWGTVTYYDPVTRRVDFEYVDAGVHRTRTFYYEGRRTRWAGLREEELRPGVAIHVHGRQNRDRWVADSIERDDRRR